MYIKIENSYLKYIIIFKIIAIFNFFFFYKCCLGEQQ